MVQVDAYYDYEDVCSSDAEAASGDAGEGMVELTVGGDPDGETAGPSSPVQAPQHDCETGTGNRDETPTALLASKLCPAPEEAPKPLADPSVCGTSL
jgi:hypothetical protein